MEKINVAVRIRPFISDEVNPDPCWTVDNSHTVIKAITDNDVKSTFNFDRIYTENITNEVIYAESCSEMIDKAIEGIDTTIFVFGQTRAGKTYTMLGEEKQPGQFTGLIFQSLRDIFLKASMCSEFEKIYFTCSYIEIYNEQVHDLLGIQQKLSEQMVIAEDTDSCKFFIKNLTKVRVDQIDDVYKVIKFGEINRKYANTQYNHQSSRSHTIFTIYTQYVLNSNGQPSLIKEGTINFVDLAGNERLVFDSAQYEPIQKNTSVNRDSILNKQRISLDNSFQSSLDQQKTSRINETKNINKSLFYLTQVIYLCAQKKPFQRIPYRNSSLTKLLRPAIGGTSRTLLIICLAPSKLDYEVSMSSLRFGRCAKKIENKVQTNMVNSYNREAIVAIVQEYERKMALYDRRLTGLETYSKNVLDFNNQNKLLKNIVTNKLINPNIKYKDIEEIKKIQNKALRYDDKLINKVGILYQLKQNDEEKLQKLQHEQKYCEACIQTKSGEKLSPKIAQSLLSGLREKEEREKRLNEILNEDLKAVENQVSNAKKEALQLAIDLKNGLKPLYKWVQNLIERDGEHQNEIDMLSNIERPKYLTREILDIYSKKIRKMEKAYNEEIVRRKYVDEVIPNQTSLFALTETKKFENYKMEFEKEYGTKLDKILDTVRHLGVSIRTKELSDKIDFYFNKVYIDNKNIEQNFSKYINEAELRIKLQEKKNLWTKNEIKNMTNYFDSQYLNPVHLIQKQKSFQNLKIPITEFKLTQKAEGIKLLELFNEIEIKNKKYSEFSQYLKETLTFRNEKVQAVPSDVPLTRLEDEELKTLNFNDADESDSQFDTNNKITTAPPLLDNPQRNIQQKKIDKPMNIYISDTFNNALKIKDLYIKKKSINVSTKMASSPNNNLNTAQLTKQNENIEIKQVKEVKEVKDQKEPTNQILFERKSTLPKIQKQVKKYADDIWKSVVDVSDNKSLNVTKNQNSRLSEIKGKYIVPFKSGVSYTSEINYLSKKQIIQNYFSF